MAADGRNNCNGNYNGNVKSVGRGFTRILNGETARIRPLQRQLQCFCENPSGKGRGVR